MFKKLSLAAVALVAVAGIAFAAGNFGLWPILGGASYCGSTNNSVCVQTVPAGPVAMTGLETIPADTNAAQGIQPQTVLVPIQSLGGGANTINSTTGAQTPVVANGVSNYIYTGAGAATFTTFTFPTTPVNNQKLCIVNASSGIITLSSLLVGTAGQLFVGVTPTSLPVMTAVGTAGTVTLGTNCWVYNVPTTTWYRTL